MKSFLKSVNLGFIYICHYTVDRVGWLRLFQTSWGIHWKHISNTLIFSERNGYVKLYRIGNYYFKILKPYKKTT